MCENTGNAVYAVRVESVYHLKTWSAFHVQAARLDALHPIDSSRLDEVSAFYSRLERTTDLIVRNT